MYALDIPSTNLIQEEQLRNNLQLSISFSRNRMKELVMLIRSSTFKEAQSILCTVYFRCGVWTSFKTIKVNERTLRLVTWDTGNWDFYLFINLTCNFKCNCVKVLSLSFLGVHFPFCLSLY